MITLASASACISAPIERVFSFVSNMENYQQWFPGVIAICAADSLAVSTPGKTYTETLQLPDGDMALTITVDRYEVNRLFQTKGDLPGLLPQMTVRFAVCPTGGCEVSLTYHSRNTELAESSEVVIQLQEDLNIRAKQGLETLTSLMESQTGKEQATGTGHLHSDRH